MRIRARRALAFLLWATSTPSTASAGNDDTYFMSLPAGLLGGAVSAIAGDAGCIWYNPAGLGTITRQELNLSLTVAAWQARQIEAGLASSFGGRNLTTTLDGNRTTIVSPSTAYVRRLSGVTVGGGLFVSRDDVADLAGTTQVRVGQREGFSYAALSTSELRYHLGLATGFPVREKVRLGFGAFLVYGGIDSDVRAALSATDLDSALSTTAVQVDSRDRTTRWGLQLTAGLQIDVLQPLTLSLFLRSPILLLHDNPDTQVAATVVQDDAGAQRFVGQLLRAGRPGQPIESLQLVVGLGYEPTRWGLYVEASWAHGLLGEDLALAGSEPRYLVNRKTLWNARGGVQVDVTHDVRLGAGLFTDRSPKRSSQGTTDFDVDYYGATLGAVWTQRVALAPSEREDSLLFGTAVSLRYAYGSGSTAQLLVDPETGALDESGTVPVTFHELYIMVGSSLQF